MIPIIKLRLPGFQEILPTYAVIVFTLFGWVTLDFFWKLPAWLLYLNLGEVATIYAYTAMTEFLESLVFLGILLALCAALPARALRDEFPVRGPLLALGLIGFVFLLNSALAFYPFFGIALAFPGALAIAGASLALLLWLADRSNIFERGIRVMADRTVILLYIYAPVVLVSLVIVLFANLA